MTPPGSKPGAPCDAVSNACTGVDLDTYAILPSNTLFSEIVRVALVKLGYTAAEAIGAKGMNHLTERITCFAWCQKRLGILTEAGKTLEIFVLGWLFCVGVNPAVPLRVVFLVVCFRCDSDPELEAADV